MRALFATIVLVSCSIGPGEHLADLPGQTWALSADESGVYAMTNEKVVYVPHGGAPRVLDVPGFGSAIGSDRILWTTHGAGTTQINALPKAGGTPTVVGTLAGDGPVGLAVDATTVFILQGGPPGLTTTIQAMPIEGGAISTVRSGSITFLGSDNGRVFFRERTPTYELAIRSVGIDGSGMLTHESGDLLYDACDGVAAGVLYFSRIGFKQFRLDLVTSAEVQVGSLVEGCLGAADARGAVYFADACPPPSGEEDLPPCPTELYELPRLSPIARYDAGGRAPIAVAGDFVYWVLHGTDLRRVRR